MGLGLTLATAEEVEEAARQAQLRAWGDAAFTAAEGAAVVRTAVALREVQAFTAGLVEPVASGQEQAQRGHNQRVVVEVPRMPTAAQVAMVASSCILSRHTLGGNYG
jgi:enterochelin esterase-like enzyme